MNTPEDFATTFSKEDKFLDSVFPLFSESFQNLWATLKENILLSEGKIMS